MKKVILITGASSGIGFNTAKALAHAGHRVYAAARRTERMEPLQADGVVTMAMDVTDDASMQEAVEYIIEHEGRIDVLVNNAGYGYFGAIENVTMAEARRQIEVNVFGLARLCQLVLPAMRAQHSGRIVNISSIAGKSVMMYGGWYHVSKYSVEALSDALRIEMKPFGVDVVLIEPGPIKTDWGLIAADNLEASSKGTAYETTGCQEADSLRKAYLSNLISGPEVVTTAICKAVDSRRPRIRYRAGAISGTAVFMHRILPDRWWDALMRFIATRKLKD
mgnify:CR=1 FL=1